MFRFIKFIFFVIYLLVNKIINIFVYKQIDKCAINNF